jgi:hypothetical protein
MFLLQQLIHLAWRWSFVNLNRNMKTSDKTSQSSWMHEILIFFNLDKNKRLLLICSFILVRSSVQYTAKIVDHLGNSDTWLISQTFGFPNTCYSAKISFSSNYRLVTLINNCLIWGYLMDATANIGWVSERLFNANSAIFQLYHGEQVILKSLFKLGAFQLNLLLLSQISMCRVSRMKSYIMIINWKDE